MISGFLIKALAIAILCFCPPDNVFGFLFPKPAKSTSSKIFSTASLSFFLP
jgi:hypothetical protein